jgi:hypothetical protein
MKKNLQKSYWVGMLMLAFSLLGRPSWFQIYAKAQKMSQKSEARTAPEVQKLRGVLKELKSHYKVDILFEGGLVEGVMVSSDLLDFNATLEYNLDKILRPSGLNFKKVKDGSYVILETKKPKKTAEADARFQESVNPKSQLTDSPQTLTSDISSLRIIEKVEATVQTIKGKVTDEKGVGLPGVSILIKGSQRGTSTNADGGFQLEVPNATAVLVFSYVGYESKEITVGSQTTINLSLNPESTSLGEVVVTAWA